jgi:hypothetical protein
MKRALLASLLFVVGIAAGADVSAQMFTPVVVKAFGPHAVLVEVSTGAVIPCDSSSNTPLYKATMSPGNVVALRTPTPCVCWRQTFDNFPNVNWSKSLVVCKSGWICKGRRCVPDPDPALRIDVYSTERTW